MCSSRWKSDLYWYIDRLFDERIDLNDFYLGALMRNSGILVANDANKDRAKAIIANTHRLGLTNTIVTNLDGRQFSEVQTMDKIRMF